jgi:hypothetical protein
MKGGMDAPISRNAGGGAPEAPVQAKSEAPRGTAMDRAPGGRRLFAKDMKQLCVHEACRGYRPREVRGWGRARRQEY